MADNVNHPAHYNTGEIEVISYIKDIEDWEQNIKINYVYR